MRSLLLVALLSMSTVTAPITARAAVDPAGLRFWAQGDTIRTDANGTWVWDMTITNGLGVGFYGDSLRLTATNVDAAVDDPARLDSRSLTAMRTLIATISSQDTLVIQFAIPAPFENADLVLRMDGHTHEGERIMREVPLVARGGVITEMNPSRMVRAGKNTVEIVQMPAFNVAADAPGILLIGPANARTRSLLRTGLLLQPRGWHVVLLGLPARGLDAGDNLAAANAALDALLATPGVDPKRVGVWGVHEGAAVALHLAAARSEVASVLAQSTVPANPLPFEKSRQMKSAVFLLYGEQDPISKASDARQFEAALKAGSVPVESRYLTAGHDISFSTALQTAIRFFKGRFSAQP